MPEYIFLTLEGFTFQPASESCEPDLENAQLVGIAEGADQRRAFENLVRQNNWLLDTSFDEVYCYELAKGFGATRQEFSIRDARGESGRRSTRRRVRSGTHVRSVKSRRSAGLPLKGKPGNWIAIVGESQRVVVAEGRRLSTVVGEVRKAGLKNVTYARVPHVDHTLVI